MHPIHPRTTMVRRRTVPAAAVCLSVAGLLMMPGPGTGQDHGHPEGDASRLGAVTFPVSCDAPVTRAFERAVAMLHSFWFEAATREFEAVVDADPDCAMGRWGIAMTMMGNPMARTPPSSERQRIGRAAAERARALAERTTERERMYADAVVAYYAEEDAGFSERMAAHEAAMRALHEAFPDDPEATTFYARAMVAGAPPEDLTFAKQVAAAELMQPLFETMPRHPGLAHYIIHAYDAPPLAERGRDAAFAYAEIAPSAPHALHMPSHIFTRMGYWDESIESNHQSAGAEGDYYSAVHPLDYMVYAYLQQGRDAEAKAILDRAVHETDRFYGSILGYNFLAMPARFALERSAWAEATRLPVPDEASAYAQAIPRFARAIGWARTAAAAAPGSGARASALERASDEGEALGRLQAALLEEGDAYWATIVQAQRLAVEAWTAQAAGNSAAARVLAREAAEVEETVEKHPVTPGPLLPARELEGDLLLELGEAAEALASYQATLEREPRRSRTLFGAARSAEAAGQPELAREYYSQILEVMERADKERPEPEVARRALAGT